MSNTFSKLRSVTFSVSSELYIVQPSQEEDCSIIWYSSNDRYNFRQSMIQTIRKVSQEIEEIPPGLTMSQEQLIDCLGIESFISKGAAKRAAEARRAHINAILSEQSRQKQDGTCDIIRLRNISWKSSRVAIERARKLAVGYSALAT